MDNPKEKADDLLNILRKGKSIYDNFNNSFRTNYLIAGKTIEGWEKQFKLKIPADPDLATCRLLDLKLMELHQEASFHKASSDAIVEALHNGSETEFHTRFTTLVNQYQSTNQKLPAAATLEVLAKTELDDVTTAVVSAKVAADFWQSIIDHLTFCRKLLEQIVMSHGVEAKSLQTERYIDSLSKRNGQ